MLRVSADRRGCFRRGGFRLPSACAAGPRALRPPVLHVNYGLRGAESDRDEEFVRELAGHCGLPVQVLIAPVQRGNIEQEARRARYDFFANQIASGICDAVATGHTLDDQAETVLYRFLRGAGTAGLSGIRPAATSGVVRPLIELRRDDIRSWLKDHNISGGRKTAPTRISNSCVTASGCVTCRNSPPM